MLTEKEYPQMGTGLSKERHNSSQNGLGVYKRDENVPFVKPDKVLNWYRSGQTLELQLECKQWINRTVYTHETHMHQFALTNESAPIMHLYIEFFYEYTFRLRFTLDADLKPDGSYPPPESRMLCGQPQVVDAKLTEKDEHIVFPNAYLNIYVSKQPFAISVRNAAGQLCFEQKRSELFTADVFDISCADRNDCRACFDSFVLMPGERVYGLGERFDHLDRRGKYVDFWNKDAIGTSSPRTYINVPFLMTTRGWGLFVNSSYPMEWEIGTLDASTLGVGVEDGTMDYFVILGPNPADILKRYTKLTGAPGLPPVWSFGLWMSRNSYLSWDVVEGVARELRARDIPADVLHLDTAWFTEDWNCDLRFSKERFPDPQTHIAELRKQGFHISLWQYNFVPPKNDNVNYIEGCKYGYFVKDDAGNPIPCAPGHDGSWTSDVIIDFTNPKAAQWYASQIEGLIELGADAIKTDFGEGVTTSGHYKNIDGKAVHNLYSLIYNSVIYKAIKRVNPQSIVWARSGTAGSQRYPVHWGGDSQCSWAGLEGTLRAALNLGLSGIPFFSHDVGGFIGRPDPELYIRWAQLGFFSSHTRCHGAGNTNSREPWSFGAEAEEIFRKYDELRYALIPYIYGEALKCVDTSKPMVRALVIENPEDRNVWSIDDQYYFGDNILVAPILAPMSTTTRRAVYLPAGIWYDFWTHAKYESRGEWIEYAVKLETMPIFVKAGCALPYAAKRQYLEGVGKVARLEIFGHGFDNWTYYTGEQQIVVVEGVNGITVKGCDGACIEYID